MHTQTVKQLVSPQFRRWLNEIVFELKDVSLSRNELKDITDSPCTKAGRILHDACRRYHIYTSAQLHHVGLDGLLRCRGIGERSAWVAACILEYMGLNVDVWIDRKRRVTRTTRGTIKLVHSQTRKQKHG